VSDDDVVKQVRGPSEVAVDDFVAHVRGGGSARTQKVARDVVLALMPGGPIVMRLDVGALTLMVSERGIPEEVCLDGVRRGFLTVARTLGMQERLVGYLAQGVEDAIARYSRDLEAFASGEAT
jgi:hypothetical protein